jgi:hypothetical protein
MKTVGFDAVMNEDNKDMEEVDEFDKGWDVALENEAFCEKMMELGCKNMMRMWVPYRRRWVTEKRKEKKRTPSPSIFIACLTT